MSSSDSLKVKAEGQSNGRFEDAISLLSNTRVHKDWDNLQYQVSTPLVWCHRSLLQPLTMPRGTCPIHPLLHFTSSHPSQHLGQHQAYKTHIFTINYVKYQKRPHNFIDD